MKTKFKIAFLGSSLVSAYWNGAATYYRGIIRALHARGHEITFYEPDAFDRQKNRDIPDPDYVRSVVFPAESESDVRRMLATIGEVDLLVKASGVGVWDEFLERAVLEFQNKNTKVVFWDVDAPATLDRVAENPGDYFHPLIPEYDIILTYGGGEPVIEKYNRFGARQCVPVYNALDPDTHFPVAPDSRFEATLGFLGNRMPDREKRVWEFFFKPAEELSDERFLLGGSGWENYVPDLSNIKYLGHVFTRDHNAFNCTPTAVLNISRESMAKNGFSPATRVFEAAGAGACIITDFWEGIELFLEPGRECLVARSGEEVIQILKDLFPGQAQEIGRAARQRVLSEHTYMHRALQLEEVLTAIRHATREVIS